MLALPAGHLQIVLQSRGLVNVHTPEEADGLLGEGGVEEEEHGYDHNHRVPEQRGLASSDALPDQEDGEEEEGDYEGHEAVDEGLHDVLRVLEEGEVEVLEEAVEGEDGVTLRVEQGGRAQQLLEGLGVLHVEGKGCRHRLEVVGRYFGQD